MNRDDFPLALITGGAKRIGRCIAETLHNTHNIIITYHQSKEDAQSLCDSLNQIRQQSAFAYPLNGFDKIAVQRFCTTLKANHPTLSLLINNASVFYPDNADTPDALFEAMMQLHVITPSHLSHFLMHTLKPSHANIINITDIHASHPLKHYSIYTQSKAALLMQTKSLADRFAPVCRVNAIAPGAILWPEGVNTLSTTQKTAILDKNVLKKHGQPADIAKTVLFIIDSPYLTGQEIHIDGGRYL